MLHIAPNRAALLISLYCSQYNDNKGTLTFDFDIFWSSLLERLDDINWTDFIKTFNSKMSQTQININNNQKENVSSKKSHLAKDFICGFETVKLINVLCISSETCVC